MLSVLPLQPIMDTEKMVACQHRTVNKLCDMNSIYVQHALVYHSAACDKGSFYMRTQTDMSLPRK